MAVRYEPEYSKGEILVNFREDIDPSPDLARSFGMRLGYELKGFWDHGDNTFIYSTSEGEEEKACLMFKKHADFVDWAEKRDLKMETRWDSLEEIISMMRSLRDNPGLPDKQYDDKLKEISDYITKHR